MSGPAVPGRLGLHTRRADILVVAAGVPGLIRAEHVREGAVVLDVGISQVTDPDDRGQAAWPATWISTRSPRGCGRSRPFPAGSAR